MSAQIRRVMSFLSIFSFEASRQRAAERALRGAGTVGEAERRQRAMEGGTSLFR